MSSELPIVFLAFANSLDDHLAKLKDESRDIFRALQPLQKENRIDIHREESSEFDELYQDLLAYDDRIVIFHYGGHADGATLTLEGGAGAAGGIAGLLGQQSSLKLVFLNGCATKDQVRLLHAAGVPAVIATSVKINDGRATQFSTAFYSALAEGSSILAAFESASNYIEGKFGSDGSSGISINRFPVHDFEEEDAAPGVFEWALYLNRNTTQDLEQWRLPEAREDWRVQLEDTRGPLRDLDGNPQLIERRSRFRTMDAIRCTTCGTISSIASDSTSKCPICGSDEVEVETASTQITDQVLPFLIDENDARKRVLESVGAESSQAIRLAQVFLPYWAFSVDTRTTLEAERGVNRALAEVAPKLEWESVKETIELGFEAYLTLAATVPSGGAVAAGDWYWELDRAESPEGVPEDKASIPLDVPIDLAFQQFTEHFDRELEAEVAELVGGHQQKNISTDTRYRKVSAQSFLLPHWFATVNLEEGQTGLLVNGQTGAVRQLQLPGTVQLSNGSQANMAKRTYEPNEQQPGSSRAISVFSGAGIGLMVGAMLGLAMSPTVATFVGAIGAVLAALLGLNDRHFSFNKGLRIGAFGLFALAGVAAGMYAKEYRVFAPSLLEQKQKMLDAGFSECQAQDLLSGLSLRVLPPDNHEHLNERKKAFMDAGFSRCQALHLLAGRPAATGNPSAEDGRGQKIAATDRALEASGLMATKVEFTACGKLKGLPYPAEHPYEKVHEQFVSHKKNWAAYAESVFSSNMSDKEKRELLYAARFAVCLEKVQLTKLECKNLNFVASKSGAEDTELLTAFGEIDDLKPVRDRVTQNINSPSNQELALKLLLTKALCQDS